MPDPSDPTMSRRSLLGAAAGSLASAALPAGAAMKPAAIPDLWAALRKLRYRLDETLFYWWLKATKYGRLGNRVQPLYDMDIGTIFQARDTGGGGFEVTSLEIAFTVDRDSGELLERFRNPYTDELLTPRDVPVGPATIRYGSSGPVFPVELPGADLDVRPSIELLVRAGGELWLREDTASVVTPKTGEGQPFYVTDWATYQASIADLENPALASAPCTVSFQAISSWPRWLAMGAREGGTLSRASGRKVESYAELPASFRQRLADAFPEIAKDPAAALRRPPFQFAP